MNTLQINLKLGVKIRDGLSWIGLYAQKERTQESMDAARLCLELAAEHDDVREVSIDVPIVHVLCQLAEHFRAEHNAKAVDRIEHIVKLLKAGQNRTILGTINLEGKTAGEIEGKLEQLRDAAVRQLSRVQR